MYTEQDVPALVQTVMLSRFAFEKFYQHGRVIVEKTPPPPGHYKDLYAALRKLKIVDKVSPRVQDAVARELYRQYRGGQS